MNGSQSTNPAGLTDASLELFTAYAKDAGNWAGAPLVGGNVGCTHKDRGNLTDLKKKGLVKTSSDGNYMFVEFTNAGIRLANSLGITCEHWRTIDPEPDDPADTEGGAS